MSQTTLVVLIVGILVVLGIIAVYLVMKAVGRRPKLHDLPPESRDRYLHSWQTIEAKFIDNPAEAVRDADRCAVGILSERGATLHNEHGVPQELQQARQASSSDKGQGTEGMREAMLHYKHIVTDAVGDTSRKREGYRPEVA